MQAEPPRASPSLDRCQMCNILQARSDRWRYIRNHFWEAWQWVCPSCASQAKREGKEVRTAGEL